MLATAVLPGITFEAAAPPLVESLPRMDIAAFVGFATTGPLNTPVAVEDITRFRDIFGNDQQLAWDPKEGRLIHAFLGPTVDSFFRNGGRRCWIVRVASEPQLHKFELPQLRVINTLEPATVFARAEGSWCEDLEVSTALSKQRLFARTIIESPSSVIAFDRGQAVVIPGMSTDDLVSGDLLEVMLDAGLGMYLFVDSTLVTDGGVRLTALEIVWFETESVTSPAVDSGIRFLSQADAELRLAALLPGGQIEIHRLSLSLIVWRGESVIATLGGLGFHQKHTRFWGHLPDDEQLFRTSIGRAEQTHLLETERLFAEVSAPRFPLSGPVDESSPHAYIPVGMTQDTDNSSAVGISSAEGTMLERDGLNNFSWRLFVDQDLFSVDATSLLREAEHKYYHRGESLNGFHALLPIREPTLISVPDASHAGWSQKTTDSKSTRLESPVLDNADRIGTDPATFQISWTLVDRAQHYELQQANDVEFKSEASAVRRVRAHHVLLPDDDCVNKIFLRVRAVHAEDISPWSNTVTIANVNNAFIDCDTILIPGLIIESVAITSPALATQINWSESRADSPSTFPSNTLQVDLEQSVDPGFITATTVYTGTDMSIEIPTPSVTTYLRVRGRIDSKIGIWSNSIVVEAVETDWILQPVGDGALDLLAVQRALLRFCSARRDLLAVLSVSRDYRYQEVMEHVHQLRPVTAGEILVMDSSQVPPLRYFEAPILGFGTLFHPWVITTNGQNDDARTSFNLLLQPPDGVVVGSIAERSLFDGAWIAPANTELRGIIGLEPTLDLDAQSSLVSGRVNPLIQTPRGFLVWNADTLSLDENRRPINVRRLLSLLYRLALREGNICVFESNDQDFHGRVRHRFERVLSDLFVRGAFAGNQPEQAFRVVVDGSVNPPVSIEGGRFVVELRVAPSQPLAFLHVRLVQDGPERLFLDEV